MVEGLLGEAGALALRGMGGIGKTTLARKVAHSIADHFPDALIEHNLQGMADVPLTTSAVMGDIIHAFHPEEKLPEGASARQARYFEVLRSKRALILLDNVKDEEQVQALVAAPLPVGFILTSRNALALDGVESILLKRLLPAEATDLLRQIVKEKGTDDELRAVAELCGHLPLALRVAGDFLRIHENWTVQRYIEALEDEGKRLDRLRGNTQERDVRAVLGFSAAGLVRSNSERAELWQMLSVFPAEFAPDAAAAVWDLNKDGESDTVTAVDELTALLDRSLVQFNERTNRYSLHDLMAPVARDVFEYAENPLQPTGLVNRLRLAEQRFAIHYQRILATANNLYKKGHDNVLRGLALFDMEEGNIRRGQWWATGNRADNTLAAALCRDYPRDGGFVIAIRLTGKEQIEWLEPAIEACQQIGDRVWEGRTLGKLGIAYQKLGDARKARTLYEQNLAIAREIGDRVEEGYALRHLGIACSHLGDSREAITFYEQSLAIAREIGDRAGEGSALNNLGTAYWEIGDASKAITFYEQNLAIAREIGDRVEEEHSLVNLGVAYHTLGDASKAITFYEQSLAIAREIGDRVGEGRAVGNIGGAYRDLGDASKAITFFKQRLAIAREIGDQRGEAICRWNMANSLADLGQYEHAIRFAEPAQEFFESIGHPDAEADRKTLAQWRTVILQPNVTTTASEMIPAVPSDATVANPSDQPAPIESGGRCDWGPIDGVSDEQICAWFDGDNLGDWLRYLQVFWCIGVMEREAFESLGLALGYDKLSAALKEREPSFRHIGLPKSVTYISTTCLPELAARFNCEPFLSQAWTEREAVSDLRVPRMIGDREHGQWTPRARKAWHYIDRFLTLRGLRPTFAVKDPPADASGMS